MVQLHNTQKLLLVMLTAPLGLIGVSIALLLSHRLFGFVAMLGVFAPLRRSRSSAVSALCSTCEAASSD
jgi:hypothetical protein